MTVCTKCADAALEKYRKLAASGRPITACVHCKQTLLSQDPSARRWPKTRFEHYFCEKCIEKVLYSQSNICMNCKRPLTIRGHRMIRDSQSTPGQAKAYLRKEFGRKVA